MTADPEKKQGADSGKKTPPKDFVIPPKKPKLSKAERRALQEQQRAAKSGKQPGQKSTAAVQQQQKQQQQHQQQQQQQQQQQTKPKTVPQSSKQAKTQDVPPLVNKKAHQNSQQVRLLAHLPPYRDPRDNPDHFLGVNLGGDLNSGLHPQVLQLGYQYASGLIRGGNARCRAMLKCFILVLKDVSPPQEEGDVRHYLVNRILKPSFQYWTTQCRPHAVSMGNAFSFVKQAIFSLERDMEWNDMLVVLEDTIVAYIRERIDFAARVIAEKAGEKIVDGDVVLTYGRSEAIAHLFKEAARTKDFRVIVVDSKPLLEGKNFVEQLRNAGLDCTYILMNALSYVMPEVTKVFLGTASLQSDGSMLSRVGTACVALAAHSKHIPVLVCGETYKITNRTQLESITNNEMGNPQDVMEGAENLRVINLLYDLTPATFISGIITEMGILPPSSVAVLLREMNPTNAQY